YRFFEERMGSPHWAERVGPLLVVGIDDAVVSVEGAQEAWLRQTLAERGGVPWIAVCHRPPRFLEQEAAPVEHDLVDLVALLEADPPLVVVCGHLHHSFERRVGGVLYVVNAHGGDVHGLALTRGPFDLLRVDVSEDGTVRRETTRHPRRPWFRVYADQLAVRCWWSRRRGLGRLLAVPAALLLGALGQRAPLEDPRRPA
ncbi:MAG: metallophosphoesterase, partial [Planctomycetota bacterium]